MNNKINQYIKSCDFGEEIFRDYYGEGNEEYFNRDKNTHDKEKSRCVDILIRLDDVSESEFIKASKEVFGGRLELVNGEIEYTAGQFYDLEKPIAMSAVLAKIESNRK